MNGSAIQNVSESTGAGWGLALVIAAIFTVDFPLFGDDHVPYWAYGLKFVALFFTVLTLTRVFSRPRDAKKLAALSVASAVLIVAFVVAFIVAR